MTTAGKSLEGFRPQFGEPLVDPPPRRPFLFHAHAVDPLRLHVVASDFASNTFHRVLAIPDLDDLRDVAGIGGLWSEFVDYLSDSFSSDDVRLVFGVDNDDSVIMSAKLIARKSKGMPSITFLLDKSSDTSSCDLVASLSFSLYKALNDTSKNAIKDREYNLQLAGLLSSEKEKNKDLQRQLDAFTFKSKWSPSKSKVSEKPLPVAENPSIYQHNLVPETQQPSVSSQDNVPVRASQRSVRGRRAKARGALLLDAGDNSDL